jgi:hypothetical protein
MFPFISLPAISIIPSDQIREIDTGNFMLFEENIRNFGRT